MAAATDPKRGRALMDRFDEWIDLVEQELWRATGQYPMASSCLRPSLDVPSAESGDVLPAAVHHVNLGGVGEHSRRANRRRDAMWGGDVLAVFRNSHGSRR